MLWASGDGDGDFTQSSSEQENVALGWLAGGIYDSGVGAGVESLSQLF